MTATRESLSMNRMHRSRGLLVCAAVLVTACSTDLTGINVDPNNPSSAPPAALFTSATNSAVSILNNSFVTLSMTSLFAQHIAQVQYVEEDRGHIRPENIDALNATIYSGPLADLKKVRVAGTAARAPGVWGPAAVMQTWIFQNLTDLWGDIPYSQALQGDSVGGSLAPAYDAQKDIYYGMLRTLTDASVAMKSAPTGGASLGAGDIVYGGNLQKWQRFSNTLRARMALRMLRNDRAMALAELTAALADGLLTSNDDNAAVAWPGDGTFDNPLASNFATRDDHRVSKTLLDTLIALNDPRTSIFAQPTKDDSSRYAGLQNGLDNATAAAFFNTTSRPGAIFYPGATVYGTFGTAAGKTTPSYLATFAEAAFIEAEAAELGIGGATGAAAHYRDAVTASITQWGGSASDAAAYLAQPGVVYAGGAEGLRQIGLQKWISMYTQGMEAWSEWRRTGNPATIRMGPQAFSDVLQVPRRIPYPGNEQSVNAVNLAAAIARQGPDTYLTRMWWDK